MANPHEVVIELGSSDEETEPAPKKKKPMPNAMVHIPNKLPGVTIKPASKPKINPVSIATNAAIGKGITVTKLASGGKLSNPFATKSKQNGKPIARHPIIQGPRSVIPHIANSGLTITPTLKRGQQLPIGKMPLKIATGIVTAPSRVRQLPQTSLPPGITVKRTSQLQSVMRPNLKANPVNMQAKNKTIRASKRPKTSEMVCVDLDDDDATPSTTGPQWYLRPEDQQNDKSIESEEKSADLKETSEVVAATAEKETADLEKENNKEPETPNYIEITIEDSPAKPPKSKRACEVTDMAITVDDSPVKGAVEKPAPDNSSDEETTSSSKDKNSKKKLEYPKADKVANTVEIEIELTPVQGNARQEDETIPQDAGHGEDAEILEIEESPVKLPEILHTSTPKKKLLKPQTTRVAKPQLQLISKTTSQSVLKLNENKTVNPITPGEFHPTYQSFIDLCFKLENSEDMIKIVEKKIKAYYKQVPKDYTESEMFIDMVASKINAMKAGPEKMYLYIKDVVDELNMQRKIAKTQPVAKLDTVNEEQEKFLYGEESEFDSKRQRQIRKLEKTLKKLHRAIQKLEEQEVDFDDEEDSVYLLTESEEGTSMDKAQPLEKSDLLKRYKERMIRVHAKFCQLTNTKMPSEPRVQIDARPGQPKGPAKRLEKWINKKVPIGTPLPFPDFHDVLRCVRDANQEDKLGWNEADIMEEARDLFTRCGKKLQRRRQENEWRLAASRIQSELDPAEESEDLKKKLDDNQRVASKKESEVLNKYADRQNQLNLEAVEIGDKEADQSPVETDDDEPTEDSTSLETKEKRKQRLKRLLQEKTKKATDEKEQGDIDNEMLDDNAQQRKEEEDNAETKTSAHKSNDDNSQNETKNVEKQNNKEKDPLDDTDNKDKIENENIHSLSSDSQKIDSDIDELNLLQKLHSDVVDTSTLESSDSESPIAISDTLSSGDNKKQASDVISIENSSYSESEKNNEQDYEMVSFSQKKIITESVDVQMEIECSNAGIQKKINKSTNDEYNESVEDILLASSDDETSKDLSVDPLSRDEVNIGHPKVGNTNENDENTENKNNADTTDISSMKNIEMSVGDSTISNENNDTTDVANITTTKCDNDEITKAAKATSVNSEENVLSNENNDDATDVANITATKSDTDESTKVAKATKVNTEDVPSSNSNTELVSAKTTKSVDGETATSIVEETAVANAKNYDTIEHELMLENPKENDTDEKTSDKNADIIVEDRFLGATGDSENTKENDTDDKTNDTNADIIVEALISTTNSLETADKLQSMDEVMSNTDKLKMTMNVNTTQSAEHEITNTDNISKDTNDEGVSSDVKSAEADVAVENSDVPMEVSEILPATEPMEVVVDKI